MELESDQDFIVIIVKDDHESSGSSVVPIETLETLLDETFCENKPEVIKATHEEYDINSESYNLVEQDTNGLIPKEKLTPERHSMVQKNIVEKINFVRKMLCSDSEDSKTCLNSKDVYSSSTCENSKSYINKLKMQFPELMEDEELLLDIVVKMMKELKVPTVPDIFWVKQNKQYKCKICDSVTDCLNAATKHYEKKHGKRYLICYACGKNFTCTTNLYRHEKMSCKDPDIDIVLKARAISCCRKSDPNGHKGKRKLPTQFFYCADCPSVFRSKFNLISHVYKHMGKRPFRCDKCPNAYTALAKLKRHYEIHDSIQHLCNICSRSFQTKTSLEAHLHTHIPTKRFQCPECDQGYAQRFGLTTHINKVHRNLPYPYACQQCPKRFPRLFYLKKHMAARHGINIMSRKMFDKRLPKLSEEDLEKAKTVTASYVEDLTLDPFG